MHEEQNLLFDLMKVLKKYSDEDHRLKQQAILQLLKTHYGYEDIEKKRKTVKANLEKILRYSERSDENEILYEVRTRETVNKKTGKKEEINYFSDFGYLHEFTPPELRLIIDGILFSNQIPTKRREELIKKLEGLSSTYFNSRMNHIQTIGNEGPINHALFYNIEVIDKAINESKQISFQYAQYTVDENNQLRVESRKNKEGQPREYTINPYQMAATNGRYYLICNNVYFDSLSHYRLDRMMNIQLLDRKRKPFKEVTTNEERLDLSQYMAEHIYMFGGESITVQLRFKTYLLNEFIDWFGTNTSIFSKQENDEVIARVKVNRVAMRKWALQYALHVRVLSPETLVDEIKVDLQAAMKQYE